VGENTLTVAFVRAQHHFTPKLNLDLVCGGLFGGELNIEDANGREVASEKYDTAPFFALTLSGRF
jgi:hypothetical protein